MIRHPSSIYFTAALAIAALASVDCALAAEARGAGRSTSVALGAEDDGRQTNDRDGGRIAASGGGGVPSMRGPSRNMMKVKPDISENTMMRERMHATKNPSAKTAKDETRSPTGSITNKPTGAKAIKSAKTEAPIAPINSPTEEPSMAPTTSYYPTTSEEPSMAPTTSYNPTTSEEPTPTTPNFYPTTGKGTKSGK